MLTFEKNNKHLGTLNLKYIILDHLSGPDLTLVSQVLT